MLLLKQFRLFKKECKNLNSSIIVLREAIANDISIIEINNIKDNLEVLIEKTNDMVKAYQDIQEFLDGTEVCIQIRFLFNDIKSLLTILKYSLIAKRTKVNEEDIFNCLNIISRYTAKVLEYGKILAKYELPDNVTPLWME